VNVHAAALPMFDRHTGEVMYKMVATFLNVMCPVWIVRLLGISSDGARNMTGRVAGVVTHLSNAMHNECPLIRVWCGAHQLDLIMEFIMNSIVKERFFTTMTGFITTLRDNKILSRICRQPALESSTAGYPPRRSSSGSRLISRNCLRI